MIPLIGRVAPWLVVTAAIALSPGSVEAQLQRGAIRGVARDASGAVLPGTVVTLTSELGAPQETISGVLGEFRFVNLDPGRYDLQATLGGFAPYVRQSIIVSVATTVELLVDLQVEAQIETVRVSAATPMLESRRQGNVTNFDHVMLNEIPTARDPWALMQHLPGVTIDRPNVGGSRSATQAVLAARGDDGSNTSWNIDGVTITDPAAAGASSTYFDFNAFEEVQFTTGGIDPRQQTGALSINIVTKRGTNAWLGLARVYFSNDSLQQENLPASQQRPGLTGNRINQLAEYGGDAGGPLKRDRLWIWGAAARNDIRQLAFTGYPDDSILNSVSAKADAQPVTANHLSFFLTRNEKLVTGRFAGVTRPPETTQNQNGAVWIYKAEDAHVFGSSLFLSGKVAYLDEVFALTPQSGPNAQAYLDQATQIWHGSQLITRSERAVFQTHVDGMASRGRQDVTFGLVYREGSALERVSWPGDQTLAFINVPGLPASSGLARLTRASAFAGESDTLGFYAGDTVTAGEWTFNLGVRFDRQ
ncbi:MAG: TonB-dependent receptor, partial [Vicinamibacterales bacterium]